MDTFLKLRLRLVEIMSCEASNLLKHRRIIIEDLLNAVNQSLRDEVKTKAQEAVEK